MRRAQAETTQASYRWTIASRRGTFARVLVLAGALVAIGASPAAATIFESPTFAGYQHAAFGDPPWRVSAELKVPKVSGCGATDRAIAPGVSIFNQSAELTLAGLFVGCKNGKPHYFPTFQINDVPSSYPSAKAGPGDQIALHLSVTSSQTSLSVVNETRNTKRSATGAGAFQFGGPSIGDSAVFAGGDLLRVPDFGAVKFSDGLLQGQSFGRSVKQYNRVTPGGELQIQTGPFDSTHKVFKTYFVHP